MVPDLYLIRHGETEWNAAGRMQGWHDSPLTEKGRAQMVALAPLLQGVAARAVVSPLGRAVASARIALEGHDFATDDRLREVSLGPWDGRGFEELRAAHPDIFGDPRLGWYDRVPGGEGMAALRARVEDFLATLDAPTIIITHGVTLRMIRMVILGGMMEDGEVVQGAIHPIRGGVMETWRP